LERHRELSRITSPVKVKKICGFDVETYGQKNNYLMNTFYYNGENSTFWNRDDFINFLINNHDFQRKTMIFASNLMFDFFAVFNTSKLQQKFQLLFRNGRLLKAKTYIEKHKLVHPEEATKKYNKLEFYDTLNFFPASVETLGKVLKIPKMEKPSFIGEKPKNYQEKLYLEKYCARDSEISAEFMNFIQDNINRLGGNLKITIPSTAMDLYRRQFMKENYRTPKVESIATMYKAYYGGRTEAFNRGIFHDINVYDINSLYPYAMKTSRFPHPNYMKHDFIKTKDFDNYEGIVKAYVKVPYRHIPYLPLRSTKLIFGYGRFTGWFSIKELREAEKMGVKVYPQGKAIYSEVFFNPFKEYVNTLWKLRKKWKNEKNPAEVVAKLSLNSLYGKFGEKIIDRTEIEFIENFSREKFLKYYKKGYKMEIVDDIVITKKPIDYNFSDYVNPLIALTVTANARTILWNLLNKKDSHKTLYCDTDSIFTTNKHEVSTDLGGLKLEYKFKDLILVKPKFYAGDIGTDEIVKIKGLHIEKLEDKSKMKQFNELMETKKYTYTKFMKFFETKRRRFLDNKPYNFNVNEKIDVPKVLSFQDNKREWNRDFSILESQSSKPLLVTTG